MSGSKTALCLTAAACCLLLLGLAKAKMRLPAELAGSEELAVTGKSPRRWNGGVAFGGFHTVSVREGSEFSWSKQVFGARVGTAHKAYRLELVGPDEALHQVECHTRAIEAWKNGWSVDVTERFSPRLVCAIYTPARQRTQRLLLGSRLGLRLEGKVETADGPQAPELDIQAEHHIEGSRFQTEFPAGYLLLYEGRPAAAVETLNKGRIWFGAALPAELRGEAAAVMTALLLFDPALSPDPDS